MSDAHSWMSTAMLILIHTWSMSFEAKWTVEMCSADTLISCLSHSGSPKFDDLILAQHCILPSSLERREVEHWVLLLRTRLPLGAFYHCSHCLFQYQHTLSFNLPNLHVGTLWNIPHVRGHHIAMKRKKKKKDQKKLSNINASTHTFTRPPDSKN